MPTLPTLTVTDAQVTRLLAAFPPADGLTSVQVYKLWLRDHLIEFVLASEAQAQREQDNTALRAAQTAARTALTIDPAV